MARKQTGTKRVRAAHWKVGLGMDCGSKNFGYCVVDLVSVKPISFGRLSRRVNDLNANYQDVSDAHYDCIVRLIRRYDVDVMVSERFQTRGHGGDLIEKVGIMIGVHTTAGRDNGVDTLLTIAATWKRAFNAAHPEWSLEKDKATKVHGRLYREANDLGISDHELDASLMVCHRAGVDLASIDPQQWLANMVAAITNNDLTEVAPSIAALHY